MQIKAVTFDVGGTLIEPAPSVGHIYAEAAAHHGIKNISPDSLNARFRTAWSARQPFGHSRAAWAELVDEVFLGLAPEPPSITFFNELYNRFSETSAWRIFPDVIPALDALAAEGIKLGVISNWDERLRALLRNLKLDSYFEIFAISCEVGFAKPSPVIFEQAAMKLSLPAASILHVGDSPELDVAGARAAGFHAARIDRNNHKAQCLQSLTELRAKTASWQHPE